jgi:4-alpha-glucanotransferase
VDPTLFEPWQAASILRTARERLLTPRGLRTLDPVHPEYVGYYEGDAVDRRSAYHQGMAWSALLGFFSRAQAAALPDDFETQAEVQGYIQRAIEEGLVLGQVAQVASGDAPHRVGGCPAHAWSVAELLRTLVWDLGL